MKPTAEQLWAKRCSHGIDAMLKRVHANPAIHGDEELMNQLLTLALEADDDAAICALSALGSDLACVASNALVNAAAKGDTSGIARALQLGANINFRGRTGLTPMQSAIASMALTDNEALGIVETLATHGADIEAQGREGTALHGAAAHGRVRIVAFLVAQGARVTAENEDGYTARDRAVICGRYEVAELLRGPEMAAWRGANHPVDPALVDEVRSFLAEVGARFAEEQEPAWLRELRFRIGAHLAGAIESRRLDIAFRAAQARFDGGWLDKAQ